LKKILGLGILLIVSLAMAVSSISAYIETPEKIVLLDITDPFSPRMLQHYRCDTLIRGVLVYGRLVYLNLGKKIRILKIDDNGSIASQEEREFPYIVESMDALGKTVAIAYKGTLFITDAQFNALGSLSMGRTIKKALFFDENHVLLSFGKDGIGMVDIFNASDPRLMWRLEAKDEKIVDVTFTRDYIYAAGQNGLFFIVDISDVSKPKVIYYSSVLEKPVKIIRAASKMVYILSESGSVSIVDVSDPIEPHFIYKKAFGPMTTDIFVHKNLLYVARYGGLYVYKFQNSSLEFVDYFPAIVAKTFAQVKGIEAPPKEPGAVSWSYNAGSEIRSSPVFAGQTIFFSSINGTIFAVDINGTFKWSYKTKFLINAPLVIDGRGRIVVGGWDNHLYVISPDSRLIKRLKLGGDITKPVGIGGGRIYVGAEDGKIYAVENGRIVWSKELEGWVTTNIMVDEEGAIYFGTSDGKIYSLSYSGNILWVFHATSWVTSYIASDQNGALYFGTADGKIYKISLDGELIWKYDLGSDITAGIVVDSFGRVIAGTKDGRLVVLDRKGNFQLQFNTKGQIRSTPAVSKEGNIYFGSDDGYFYSLSIDGTLRWKYLTSGKVSTAPLVLKNLIVFGSTDGKFYAIYEETDGLDEGPWPVCCGNLMHNKLVKIH